MEEQITHDYFEMCEDEATLKIYAEYNGSYVVNVYNEDLCKEVSTLEISGIMINYCETNKLLVYDNGKFYTIEEAFEKSLLIKENLIDIQSKHKKDFPLMYSEEEKILDEKIKASYYEKNKEDLPPFCTVEDVQIIKIYGEYNGSYVMFIDVESIILGSEGKEVVADINFEYNDSRKLQVYNNGNFYTLEEAYNNSILTKDNLVDIQSKHKADFPFMYSSEKDFLLQEIKEAYYQENKDNLSDSHTVENVKIGKIYGEYSGSYVMFIDATGIYLPVEGSETIDGISFKYNDSQELKVYNEGKFYTLKEAYENLLLTKEQLIKIQSMHKADFPFNYIDE